MAAPFPTRPRTVVEPYTALTIGRRTVVSVAPAYAGGMRLLRRALVALSIASLVAGALRLRGNGGVPPQEGGWRELRVPGS